jgi:hypothetical protein
VSASSPDPGAARAREPLVVRLDRLTLFALGLGVALMLQPWWSHGLRVGFFVTLGAIVAQVVTSHRLPGEQR